MASVESVLIADWAEPGQGEALNVTGLGRENITIGSQYAAIRMAAIIELRCGYSERDNQHLVSIEISDEDAVLQVFPDYPILPIAPSKHAREGEETHRLIVRRFEEMRVPKSGLYTLWARIGDGEKKSAHFRVIMENHQENS